jgi:hypothetical protein
MCILLLFLLLFLFTAESKRSQMTGSKTWMAHVMCRRSTLLMMVLLMEEFASAGSPDVVRHHTNQPIRFGEDTEHVLLDVEVVSDDVGGLAKPRKGKR